MYRNNSFWAKIISWWNHQSGDCYLVDELSILYGYNPEDKRTLIFNYFILLGKRHIFAQRFEQKTPNIELFFAEGTNFVGGSGGILPQKIFKFGGSEALFSALVMKCVRKIDLEYENGKQLQVTIIKRLNVSGSTGALGNERKKSKALT